jgi:hypothetical protein
MNHIEENGFFVRTYKGATGFSSVSPEHAKQRAKMALINRDYMKPSDIKKLIKRDEK